jgi:hypothetical protein
MDPPRPLVVLLALALAASACSSVGGSAIRTGPVQLPAYAGPVAIYPSGEPPPGAVDLGVVEVHAAQQEGTVDVLLPQFAQKVAQIGGNIAVIDGVRARFDLATRAHVENFYYACGAGATCGGTRVYSANDELMLVPMFGRAFSTEAASSSTAPLIPQGPPRAEPVEPGPPTPTPAPETDDETDDETGADEAAP